MVGVEQSIDGHAATLGDHHGLTLDHLGEVEPAGIAQCGEESKNDGRREREGSEEKDMISYHQVLGATRESQ